MLGSEELFGVLQGKNKLACYHCLSLRGRSDFWSTCQRGALWKGAAQGLSSEALPIAFLFRAAPFCLLVYWASGCFTFS